MSIFTEIFIDTAVAARTNGSIDSFSPQWPSLTTTRHDASLIAIIDGIDVASSWRSVPARRGDALSAHSEDDLLVSRWSVVQLNSHLAVASRFSRRETLVGIVFIAACRVQLYAYEWQITQALFACTAAAAIATGPRNERSDSDSERQKVDFPRALTLDTWSFTCRECSVSSGKNEWSRGKEITISSTMLHWNAWKRVIVNYESFTCIYIRVSHDRLIGSALSECNQRINSVGLFIQRK